MPTGGERKALYFLALVALSGTGVRLMRGEAEPTSMADSTALDRQMRRVDSARAHSRAGGRPTRRPAAPTAPIDLDRATRDEIEALPGIGPALAGRIISSRDSAGTFGGLDALCDVRGIGSALAEKLRPLVTFTGAPRPVSDGCSGGSKRSGNARGRRAHEQR